MSDEIKEVELQEEVGSVTFNNDVIATIAGLAAVDIPGIAGMSGSIVSGVTELLGKKNLTKGVKVEVTEKDCKVNLTVVIEYGCKIPEVCENTQKSVKEAVETMTGLNVKEVNIYIQGVQVEKKEKASELQQEQ